MVVKLNTIDRSVAETHDFERAALALQLGASQRVDSQSRRKLIRAVNRVENAERRYRIANARVDRFKTGASVRALLAYEEQEAARAQSKAAHEIDRSTPRVRPVTVLLAEFILLVAEFAFYFDIFGRSQQDDAPFVTRILTAVMALLVPVVGIMTARFFAGSIHYLRSPADGNESPRWAWLFVVVSTALLLAACFATVRLVEWRYRAEDAASFGAADHPPGTIMAVVFAVFLLVDALTRAFMFDPAESTSIGRRWKARYTRTIDWWLLLRESHALARWQKKWFAAKALVERLKNDADQELLSATVAILIGRGDAGRPGSKLRASRLTQPYAGERPEAEGQWAGDVLRNAGAPDEQLDEENSHVFLPHRLLRLAIARLEVIRPPEDPKQERRDHSADLVRTVHRGLATAEALGGASAPQPHDMSRLDKVSPQANGKAAATDVRPNVLSG
ncbi:hypothetical protein [Mycobacterium sp. M26]|uniref:hypothetical protein n=1 Tax=Mycobacterium sp. M26 TaxID=1762962 RepID=UPI00073E2E5D|nr:hypothetical protein [Mycobacterium sp. M26]